MVDSITTTTPIDDQTGPIRDGRPATLTVAGRYEVALDDVLGAGGMAVVYRGRDLRTRRGVAMRTLRTEYQHDPALRARFRGETRLQAFAAHPNIARVFDFHEEPSASWAVHELVEGRSLCDLIDANGVFSPDDVANVLDQMADALTHLHGRGWVHLDVNPRNVLVTERGSVKLIDFGLAQTAGTVQEAIGGATFGTAAYLSPEQAAGESLGPPADTYALGCVVYELLTGAPPFSAEGDGQPKREVIEAHLHRVPDAVSAVRPDLGLPEALDDVVAWALAKDPADRYASTTAFARLFRAAVEDRVLSSSSTTAPMALIDVPAARPRPRTPTGGSLRSRPDGPSSSPDAPLAPEQRPTWPPDARRSGSFGPPAGAGSAAFAPPATRAGADAWPPASMAPARRGLIRRFLGLPYRVGGRLVRRTGWLRRLVGRLAFVVLLANVALAGAVWAVRGPDALLGRTAELGTGATARVVADVYTVRADPGLDAGPLATLPLGARLEVTGSPEAVDGLAWWPVRTTVEGESIDGYIAQPGIVAVHEGVAAGAWERARERLDRLPADAESWLTGE